MQVFTTAQIKQLNITAQAAYDALVMVEDAVCTTLDRVLCAATSDQAIRFYRTAWEVTKITAILAGGLAFYAGVLSRYGWEWLMEQCDRMVAECQISEAEPEVLALPVPAIAGLLPPAKEKLAEEVSPWDLPTPRVLITPIRIWNSEFPAAHLLPPASEPTIAEALTEVAEPKSKTRSRKTTTTAKKTTRKTGGKAKAKTEKVEA